jgi:hypothetical protein
MTLFSALGYLPRWAKYTLVPDFLRFLWWLVWVRICAVAHVIHRAAVLQGDAPWKATHRAAVQQLGWWRVLCIAT